MTAHGHGQGTQPEDAEVLILGAEPIVGRGFTDRYRVILDRGQRVIVEE